MAYQLDSDNIIDDRDGRLIPRDEGYGYGIVLKASNPFYFKGDSVAFLIGGDGALGTALASYYFRGRYQRIRKRLVRRESKLSSECVNGVAEFLGSNHRLDSGVAYYAAQRHVIFKVNHD